MSENISVRSIINSIIPISRFNKGEASKIFNEVSRNGAKIVVKNNKPACVLITPERYDEMMEIIENYYLLVEVEKRMESSTESDFMEHDDVLNDLGIDKVDLQDIELEID